jgi:hypothetical protein
MNDITRKITINGIPYTVHITKWMGKEWKLTVLGLGTNVPNVFNHTPDKCIESLKMQLKLQGKNVIVE